METLTPEALDDLLVAVDPSVLMVRGRILRRVIKRTHHVRGRLGQVPHRKALVVGRERLLECASPSELGLPEGRELPERVILLQRPSAGPEGLPRDESLVRSWRLLFHARVHARLESAEVRARLDQAAVRERVDAIGQTAFDEIRSVLDAEGLLFERRNERDEYVEFAATFLELREFAPHLLRRYFPTLEGDFERLGEILERDIDAAGLREATRPEGAPDRASGRREEKARPRRGRRRHRATRSDAAPEGDARRKALLARAEKREARGNVVRAAVLRQRAAGPRDEEVATTVDPDAARTIDRLVTRLKAALAFDAEAERDWQALLEGLLPSAAVGFRSLEGRLLYDLQKVCVDHEQLVHTIDLVEWVRSVGKRPIRRALPHQREVLMCRHLRSAAKRCVAIRLPDADRDRLEKLIKEAERAAERRLRRKCRPEIERLLTETGLRPRTVVERVARGKLVDELLDGVVARGFLSLGDVRDAVSRNQLKLGDCHGVADFWGANGLLKVDAGLGVALDGVYRRGEVYLRWLQRMSGLVFGSVVGRWLTRFVAIPFGGAFIVLKGLEEAVLHPVGNLFGTHIELIDPWFATVVAFGFYLMGLIYLPSVRDGTMTVLKAVGRGLATAFAEWPRRLLELAFVQRVLKSAGWRWFMRLVVKPVALAAVFAIPLIWIVPADAWLAWAIGLLVLAELLLNSPFGTAVEEISMEWAWKTWHRFRGTFVVGVVRFLLWVFRMLLEGLERTLYVVDEWLRFRSGEGRVTFAVKAVLGVIWWTVTWLVRVYVNLLLEPQVNPVKHFPVVTVSHKLMLPFLLVWTEAMNSLLTPVLGTFIGNAVSWTTITLLPGFFGFLVWEFKENWKLYAANRSPHLKPVLVGGHGETLIRLMRPGFHSGTLPKAYTKLRRAERKSVWTGEVVPARRQRAVIHHVEHDVAAWVTRDLIAVLKESKSFGPAMVEVVDVRAGSNRLTVSLRSESDGDRDLVLAFEEQSGWLVASIAEAGWVESLDDTRRVVFRNALCGLYKTGGVDLVREQIEADLGPEAPPYDIADSGLLVWAGPGYEVEEVRSLDPFLLGKRPLRWVDWVAAWEADRDGRDRAPLLEGLRLLPG